MDNKQKLLAQVLDLFSQKFNKSAILKGGMVLSILGSQRYTNDLDYVFVPYKSKKNVVKQILDCFNSINGAQMRHSLNSKCLRVVLTVDGVSIQIEVNVAMNIETSLISTKLFSPKFNLPTRIINIVSHSISLANKMAAWNERRLLRDIYDIWFFLQMGIKPDEKTLISRLKKPVYSKLVNEKDYFKGTTCSDFYIFLREKMRYLTDDEIKKELADYLKPEDMIGLADMFKASLVKLK